VPKLDFDWLAKSRLDLGLVNEIQLNESCLFDIELLQFYLLEQNVEGVQGLTVVPTNKLGLVVLVETSKLEIESLCLSLDMLN
jgi:hypothetical protein